MKRILIINNEFPPIGAGAGTASYYFARNLSMLGHRVTVLTAHFGNLPMVENQDGIKIQRVKCLRKKRAESNPIELLSYVNASLRFLREKLRSCEDHYDVSLCFHTIPAGFIGYALQRAHGIPYVILLRGGDVPGFLPERFRIHHMLTAPFTRLIWRYARHIIANSDGLRELAERTARKLGRRVHVVRNGVDLTAVRTGEPRQGVHDLNMVYVGRLDRQKGLNYLLRAMAMFPRDLQEKVRLKLIGDGPERQDLERLAGDLSLSNVSFSGYLPHEQVLEHLQGFDLFVLPSLYEGMSNSLLEAMATGLPALVTDIMGNNELVHHYENGLLVPPRNPSALFRAVKEILEKPSMLHRFRINTLDRIRFMDWSHRTQTLHRYLERNVPGTTAPKKETS